VRRGAAAAEVLQVAAQRRHDNRHHCNSKEQVVAKSATGAHLLERTVGRRDDPHIDLQRRVVGAQRTHLAEFRSHASSAPATTRATRTPHGAIRPTRWTTYLTSAAPRSRRSTTTQWHRSRHCSCGLRIADWSCTPQSGFAADEHLRQVSRAISPYLAPRLCHWESPLRPVEQPLRAMHTFVSGDNLHPNRAHNRLCHQHSGEGHHRNPAHDSNPSLAR